MQYPDQVELQKNSDEYKTLVGKFELIQILNENKNTDNLILKKDDMFGADEKKWQLFYDIFFPADALRPVFVVKNNKAGIHPSRGSSEEIRELFRYLLFDDSMTMQEFALQQAKKALNAPGKTLPASTGRLKGKYVPKKLNRNYNYNYNHYYGGKRKTKRTRKGKSKTRKH